MSAPPPDLDFGYAFDPDCEPDHPAHTRLVVVLRPTPTLAHFDPELLMAPVVGAHGDEDTLELYHPWPSDDPYHVLPGRVLISDRLDKRVEAFTFGGLLQIDARPERVVADLRSPVPILALQVWDSVSTVLALEVEGLLAQRRAYWDTRGQPHYFQEHLAAVEPQDLYRACLVAVREMIAAGTRPNTDREQSLLNFIGHEIHALQAANQWPLIVRPLDILL